MWMVCDYDGRRRFLAVLDSARFGEAALDDPAGS